MPFTLRNKLLFWFLIICIPCFILLIAFNVGFFNRKEKIADISDQVGNLYLCVLQDNRIHYQVGNLQSDTSKHTIAQLIDKHKQLKKEFMGRVQKTARLNDEIEFGIAMELMLIKTSYEECDSLFEMVFVKKTRVDADAAMESMDMDVMQMEQLFVFLQQKANDEKNAILTKSNYYYYAFAVVIIVLLVILSNLLARQITRPLNKLSVFISEFVESNFTLEENFPALKSRDEIATLAVNFSRMKAEILDYLKYFKEKVKERTEEVLSQRDKIIQQMEEIETQRDEISSQKMILELANKDIIDSINYARRLQDAILPDEKTIKRLFPESFVLFKPRDLVSGDFYYVEDMVSKKNHYKLFGIADCTGHGVPGAFMSLLGINGLNRAVLGQQKSTPREIAQVLNRSVYDSLHRKKTNTGIEDGLELALCQLDEKNMKLLYTGVGRPLYLVRKGELKVFNSVKKTVGNRPALGDVISHEIELQQGDMIYIFSDGYADQFGGPNIKKFKICRLKETLVKASSMSVPEQYHYIHSVFESWKGKQDQIDDVLLMGIRIAEMNLN